MEIKSSTYKVPVPPRGNAFITVAGDKTKIEFVLVHCGKAGSANTAASLAIQLLLNELLCMHNNNNQIDLEDIARSLCRIRSSERVIFDNIIINSLPDAVGTAILMFLDKEKVTNQCHKENGI